MLVSTAEFPADSLVQRFEPHLHVCYRISEALCPRKWVSLLMLVAQTVSVVFAMRLSRTRATEGEKSKMSF